MDLGILHEIFHRLKNGFCKVERVKAGLIMGLAIASGIMVCSVGYAESGSSQATMALIVLPNDFNTTVKAPISINTASAAYDTDTNISIVQQSEGITYEVWVAI